VGNPAVESIRRSWAPDLVRATPTKVWVRAYRELGWRRRSAWFRRSGAPVRRSDANRRSGRLCIHCLEHCAHW